MKLDVLNLLFYKKNFFKLFFMIFIQFRKKPIFPQSLYLVDISGLWLSEFIVAHLSLTPLR